MKDEENKKNKLFKELEKTKIKCGKIEKELEHSYEKLLKIVEDIANIITKIVEIRDPYSIGHQGRVSKLATAIAREMKLPKRKIDGIRFASLIHDVGKVNLPTEIVSRPGKLFEVEFNLIKNHPNIGYEILKNIDLPWPIAKIVLQHHEKINGSGYPQGLKGDEILLEAKILCVADVIEAMSSYKSYRPAVSMDKCLKEIIKNRNILFDSEVVNACVKIFKEKDFKFES